MSMAFRVASNHILRFGDYRGKTLDQIAQTDDGLLYLDRLVEWGGLWDETRQAIQIYLSDESIARELEQAIAAKGR